MAKETALGNPSRVSTSSGAKSANPAMTAPASRRRPDMASVNMVASLFMRCPLMCPYSMLYVLRLQVQVHTAVFCSCLPRAWKANGAAGEGRRPFGRVLRAFHALPACADRNVRATLGQHPQWRIDGGMGGVGVTVPCVRLAASPFQWLYRELVPARRAGWFGTGVSPNFGTSFAYFAVKKNTFHSRPFASIRGFTCALHHSTTAARRSHRVAA